MGLSMIRIAFEDILQMAASGFGIAVIMACLKQAHAHIQCTGSLFSGLFEQRDRFITAVQTDQCPGQTDQGMHGMRIHGQYLPVDSNRLFILGEGEIETGQRSQQIGALRCQCNGLFEIFFGRIAVIAFPRSNAAQINGIGMIR